MKGRKQLNQSFSDGQLGRKPLPNGGGLQQQQQQRQQQLQPMPMGTTKGAGSCYFLTRPAQKLPSLVDCRSGSKGRPRPICTIQDLRRSMHKRERSLRTAAAELDFEDNGDRKQHFAGPPLVGAAAPKVSWPATADPEILVPRQRWELRAEATRHILL
ncbi:unnamed protein product [Polarella glacialis]|uniref:Uncharacterized protein n=1 Tax=Polarella glacialis TaxID=89957 RepID=A0A813DJ63_POLGL|nr:unnamed protein product [Polarella glacialis]